MSIERLMDDYYQPQWLTPRRADSSLKTLSRLNFRLYPYRASVLRRAPKCEFYKELPDGSIPVYRWGQNRTEYLSGRPMEEIPALEKLRKRIAVKFGECCNHCIIIEYSDGEEHHAPPHHDRQQGVVGNGAHDMAAGSSFFVLTLGYARPFQLIDQAGDVAWEERLSHGSLLQVTATMNREYLHAVPRDPSQPDDCPRYSVIFRTIHAGVQNSST